MLTMKEAREGFITALEAEIEVAQKDDSFLSMCPPKNYQKAPMGCTLLLNPQFLLV